MQKINVLPEEVINKIAAGEVVERPSSVVKELLENSIDSGAEHIEIEFDTAGKNLIRVIDDGSGMTRDDLKTALLRHATSKLKTADDLFNINTLGFRGEALPSIAGVSKLTIITRTKESDSGNKIVVEGGKTVVDQECASAVGTTVEVKNLFFNTPARKKFLKSDATERSHILHMIEELAVVHYETGFSVTSDSKPVFNSPKASRPDERVIDILGNDVYESLVPVTADFEFIKISGFISKIEKSRPNNDMQYFFVNNRPVTNRMLTQALYDSYRGSLFVNKHPACVLFVTINPAVIDVNVHPTKRVIKFSQDKEIYDLMVKQLRDVLAKQKSPSFELPKHGNTEKGSEPRKKPATNRFDHKQNNRQFVQQQTASTPSILGALNELKEKSTEEPLPSMFELSGTHVIGQLFNTYIIAQKEQNLLIIDQHAANERVLYEKFTGIKTKINQQGLLIPETLELRPHETVLIEHLLPDLNRLGFTIEEFGKNTVVIKSFPAILGEISRIKEFVHEFIRLLIDGINEPAAKTDPQHDDKIIRAACRAAVKAHDKLTMEEIYSLINNLQKCSQPLTCPHGRPTMITITIDELEKKFKRKG
jgi:DNA mismatch repair protein MutL